MAWVEHRARELFALHALQGEWSLAFDHARTRFGQCDHRSRTISLSRVLIARASAEQIEQVLLHEIAHAIVGARAGHGARWLATARSIGYTGGRTHQIDASDELAPWRGVCPSGHEVLRFRRPAKPVSCAVCHPRFHRDYVIAWTRRELTARS